MKSANRFPYDAATALRAPGLAAVTADTTTNAFDLGREAPYIHGSDRPLAQDIAMVFVVTSLGTITDETFKLQALLDDAANLPSPTVIQEVTINAPGVYALLLDIDSLKRIAGGNANRYLAAKVDVAGTAPSIGFYCYLAPVRD